MIPMRGAGRDYQHLEEDWQELQRRADALRKAGYTEAAKAMQRAADEARWPYPGGERQ